LLEANNPESMEVKAALSPVESTNFDISVQEKWIFRMTSARTGLATHHLSDPQFSLLTTDYWGYPLQNKVDLREPY
jgi:hypothetical protein